MYISYYFEDYLADGKHTPALKFVILLFQIVKKLMQVNQIRILEKKLTNDLDIAIHKWQVSPY